MPPPANESRCIWKEASDRGLRDDNQDRAVSISPNEAGLIRRKGVLMVVCDGVGAELGGKRAAEIAVDATLDAYYAEHSIDPERALQSAITTANAAVKKEAGHRHMPNMATTLVAGVVYKNKLYVAHVGDSRAYLLREGQLMRLTQDHSSLGDVIAEGSLTSSETRKVSRRRAITRSLGTPKSTPDMNTRDLRWGDRVLLCTDGLYDALDDAQIERVLNQNPSPERASAALIRNAISNNTSDNVTVSVLNYGDAPRAIGALPINPRWLAVAAAVLVIGVLGFLVVRGLTRSNNNNGTNNGEVAGVETAAPTNADASADATPVDANAGVPASNATAAGEVLPDAPMVIPPTTDPANAPAAAPVATTGPLPTPTLGQVRPPTATPRRRGQAPTNTTNASGSAPGSAAGPTNNSSASQPAASVAGPVAGLVANGVSVYVNNRFGMELLSTGFEQWGDPVAGNGCGFFNDLAPVNQFKLTLRITNTGSNELRGLSPQFFANGGIPVSTCHDGGGALPTIPAGESRVVRLLGYLYKDQNLTSLTMNAEGRSERACFAGNKMSRC